MIPSIHLFVLTGIVLAIFGWGGLIWLVMFTLPYLGPRWLLFFLVVVALSGTAMPVVAYINRRLSVKHGFEANAVVRQSLWVGIYADLLIWLQLGRVLTFNIAIYLLIGFAAIETLLRLRETSRWRVRESDHE
ncbi:MAG: hypothetical protein HPY45_06305 [Anaerolineae bacterium]|nr:hypothetical protein [Anaerolineae bacterium]